MVFEAIESHAQFDSIFQLVSWSFFFSNWPTHSRVTPYLRAIDALDSGRSVVWFSQIEIISSLSIGVRTDLIVPVVRYHYEIDLFRLCRNWLQLSTAEIKSLLFKWKSSLSFWCSTCSILRSLSIFGKLSCHNLKPKLTHYLTFGSASASLWH